MSREALRALAPACAALALTVGIASAAAQTVESVGSQAIALEGRTSGLDSYLNEGASLQRQVPAYTERFADAELLYRLRDYSRASVLFTDIVTNYRDTPAYANSLFLLGESLFQAGDRLGARTRFREVITNASNPVFRPWIQRSLGRLIEIALRTRDVSGIEEIFQQLNQIPPSEVEAQTTYVRGKYYFLRPTPDYEAARVAFEAVPQSAPVYPQARYFLGAILTAQNRYPEAIEAFQRVLRIQPVGSEQQQVLDLSALAVGRLQIERGNYDAAIEAYQQVGRSSPHFDRALFEQAWAFIRQGDSIRAERALEILAIANPDSPLIAEGKLLWGNLLLRTGRFERAQQVFQEVRNQFGPISDQLNRVVSQNSDPAAFFRQLINANSNVFDASAFLPAPALAWLRSEGNMEDALQVVGDLNICRTYIRESEDLIARLNAALNAPSRAHVFPGLRRAREQYFQVLNRVSQLRGELGRVLDQASSGGDGNLLGVVTQRQGLDRSIQRLPTDDAGMRRRDRAAEEQFTTLGQELQRSQQQVDYMEAMVVAIERYVRDRPPERGRIDMQALRAELEQHRTAISSYRVRITELRRLLAAGRSQIGVGDPRYQRDEEVATEYAELLRRQIDMLRQAGRLPAGADAVAARLDAVDRAAHAFNARVETVVSRRIGTLRSQVQEEETRVVGYRGRLADLEREASDVVGNVVLQNFQAVRLHFYRIVMRADLGLVDVAWEIREEHNNRARMLAEEENREIRSLNDEFSEVIEGSGEPPAAGTNQGGSTAPSAAPGVGPAPPPSDATGGPAPPTAGAPGTTPAAPGAAPTSGGPGGPVSPGAQGPNR